MKKKIAIDPMQPLPSETLYYHAGEQKLAIQLYVDRLHISHTTAEDTIRKRLIEIGFKTLPPIYLPREN